MSHLSAQSEPVRPAAANHFLLIDVLRGLAAFAVVVYHCRVDLWTGFKAIAAHPSSYSTFDRLAAYLSAPVPFFRSGVMLFFLISGFCIHYPYAAGGRSMELRPYALRRFLRIYPPYLIAVLVTLLVEFACFHLAAMPRSTGTKVVQTIFMVQNYGADPYQMKGDPALWSLPIELELYILYPVFFWMVRWRGWTTAFSIVSFVSLSAFVTILLSPALHARYGLIGQVGNSLMYWIVWCAGAWLAEEVRRGSTDRLQTLEVPLAAAFGLAAALSTTRHWHIVYQEVLWSAFWFLVMRAGLRSSHSLDTLSPSITKCFVVLGTMSYSLYLIHFPFFKLCSAVWARYVGHPQANFVVALIFAVAALPVGYIFYLLIEAPSHRLAQKFGKSAVKRSTATSSKTHASKPAVNTVV